MGYGAFCRWVYQGSAPLLAAIIAFNGNQPHMELSNPGGANLMFILSEKTPGLASLSEMHMHALTIAIDSKDSITQTWTLYDKGAKKNDVVVKLARAKM